MAARIPRHWSAPTGISFASSWDCQRAFPTRIWRSLFLPQRDDVREFITGVVEKQTRELGTHERIRRVLVLPHEFTVESGELSPSMKIKRRVVEQRYQRLIDQAYAVDLHAHSHV